MPGEYLSKISKGIRNTYIDDDMLEMEEIRAQFSKREVLEKLPPWMNESGEQIWSNSRMRLAKLVLTKSFETAMGFVIATNFFAIIYETDQDGTCYPEYYHRFEDCPTAASKLIWLWGLNLGFLITYTLEAMATAFVWRKAYFYDKQLLGSLHCLIRVGARAHGESIEPGNAPIFRLARLFRAFRVFARSRELYLLINGFASSCRAIFFGMLMLLCMLLLFSILMVELVHPVNSQIHYGTCSECTGAFNSVTWSTVTLFKEVIAGGSWIISFPLIKEAPHLGLCS